MVEGMNCFGRLLDLMSARELKLYSRRAAKIVRSDMQKLHEILEDEIAERKIEL